MKNIMYQIETLKTAAKKLLISTVFLFSAAGFAADTQPATQAETAEQASEALSSLQEDLTALKYFAERVDQGRIMVLEKRIAQTDQLVKTRGLGNLGTLNSYQQLVLSFRYSESFLKSISTQSSQNNIMAVAQKVDQIIKMRGFDENITSQMVAGTLTQIENILKQIQTHEIPDPLAKWMQSSFLHRLGNAIATARANGDVPSSYLAANEIYKEVAMQYNEFYKINFKSPAFNMVTELMGLMEFYRDISTRGLRNNTQEIK